MIMTKFSVVDDDVKIEKGQFKKGKRFVPVERKKL